MIATGAGQSGVGTYYASTSNFMYFMTNSTERIRIDSSGNLNFKTSNAGIVFNNSSATTNSTLNDYETGTWSPNVGGTATYSSQVGTYTKIGNTVTVHFDFTINSIGTGSANSLFGFPFTTGNINAPQTGCVSYYAGLTVSPTFIAFYIANSSTQVNFVWNTTGGSTIQNNANNLFQNGTRIIGSLTYQATF